MDSQRLLIRVLAAAIPLVAIALVFGAIGYATTDTETTPIPPLAAAPASTPTASGAITSISGGQISLVTETGAPLTFRLDADASVEVLEPISLADVQLDDWLNGGAFPHPDTVLALERLILLPEPVTP